MKKRVLILNGQYAPGYKGGGPIQSCINIVENLYEQFEFYVVCADRDYKDEQVYSGIKINEWNEVGHAKVLYLSPDRQGIKGLEQVLNAIECDTIYLNGFFSPIFTIRPLILKRLGKIKSCKIIITPRGDFTGGCENKKIKKYSYIIIAKLLGLYKNLIWHATSNIEKNDIIKKFSNAKVITIPNLPARYVEKELSIEKKVGEVRLVFISRIFPKKNIKFALDVLKEIKEGKVVFDIYGPMEDLKYWNECKMMISQMPSNVLINYYGELEHNKIAQVFEQYHAFLFPTLGENYGHVIVEAMMNNCLCILSKGVTPWDDYIEILDIGAKLENKEKFVEIIRKLILMNKDDFVENVECMQKYIQNKNNPQEYVLKYKELLE